MIEKGKYYILTKELPFEPNTINYEYAIQKMFGGYLDDSYKHYLDDYYYKQITRQNYFSTGKFCVGRIYYCEDSNYLTDDIAIKIYIDNEMETHFEEFEFVIEEKVKELCLTLISHAPNLSFYIELKPYIKTGDKMYYSCTIGTEWQIGENQFELVRNCFNSYKKQRIETYWLQKLKVLHKKSCWH